MEKIEQENKLPIMALVNGVYAIISRNPMAFVRACLFPFVLVYLIGLWSTPAEWGQAGYYAMRLFEWVLLIGLWTTASVQLQRFVLKGGFAASPSFLPKLNPYEGRFFIASLIIGLPMAAFALWFDQPLFFHQPDILVMGGITALDGISEHLYVSLLVGWLTQLFAYVLPAIAEEDKQPLTALFKQSFDALRQNFARLFAASLIVVLPVWILVFILRLVLHMPFFTQMALQSDASALAWNLMFLLLETFKIFTGAMLLSLLWALAYGRWRKRDVTFG